MHRGKYIKTYLIVSGLTLGAIGIGLTFLPLAFKGAFGMDLSGETDIYNDYAAFGMLIFIIGMFSIASTQRQQSVVIAAFVVPALFLALFIGRLISVVLNGLPVKGLLIAGLLE